MSAIALAVALPDAIAAMSSAPSASAAVFPTFNPSLGAPTVTGDAGDNEIVRGKGGSGVVTSPIHMHGDSAGEAGVP
jgi:hypothetical protein